MQTNTVRYLCKQMKRPGTSSLADTSMPFDVAQRELFIDSRPPKSHFAAKTEPCTCSMQLNLGLPIFTTAHRAAQQLFATDSRVIGLSLLLRNAAHHHDGPSCHWRNRVVSRGQSEAFRFFGTRASIRRIALQ